MARATKPSSRQARHRRWLDDTFEISVVLKGIDGVLEVVGGVLLFFIKPATLNKLIVLATQHELSTDPHDWFANRLLLTTHNLASTERFGAIYLLLHGVIKLGLVAGLLKKQLWAYPTTIVVFGLFIIYQVYRIAGNHSIGLSLLTLFDVLVIWLVWREYRLQKQARYAG